MGAAFSVDESDCVDCFILHAKFGKGCDIVVIVVAAAPTDCVC